MGFLSKLFGQKSDAPAPPDDGDDGDFVDIDLPIASVETLASAVRIVARGTVDGEAIGLAVDLGLEWSAQPTEDAAAVFHWGHGACRSIGAESDRLVGLLARRYGMARSDMTMMLPEVPVLMVGLNCDPAQVMTTPTRTKAFFHSDSDPEDTPEAETRYAELFINVDIAGGVLQLHEKDQDYRRPLLRALTQP